jgi:hypothetical protein
MILKWMLTKTLKLFIISITTQNNGNLWLTDNMMKEKQREMMKESEFVTIKKNKKMQENNP